MKATHFTYGSVGHTLKKLPMSARMKAARNYTQQTGYRTTSKHHGFSLSSLFAYDETTEGDKYWISINERCFCRHQSHIFLNTDISCL